MRTAFAAVAALILGFGCQAHAADQNAEGKTFGKSQLNKIMDSMSDQNAKDAPLYNANPPQKSSYGAASLFDVGSGRINSCRTSTGTGSRIADQECEAVNFLAKNPENRVRFNLNPSDPAVLASRGHANSAAGMLDLVSGGQACTDRTTTTPAERTSETCAEYVPVEEKSCTVGQRVDVNADSNFQCDVTYKAYETLKCERRLTVSCEAPAGNCAAGGLRPGSAVVTDGTGDVKWDGTHLTLSNKHNRTNVTTSATVAFEIDDVSRMTTFMVDSLTSDNWVAIRINGTMVGVHSRHFGGNFWRYTNTFEVRQVTSCIELESGPQCGTETQVVYGPGPNDYGPPETRTFAVSNPAVNLLPYLVNGRNTLIAYNVNGGNVAEVNVQILANQRCPTTCTDGWTDNCGALRARAQ